MQVQRIAVDKIDPSPFNPRKDFNKEVIAEIGASLLRDGQQQPIKVRPGKGGRFDLVFGEQRVRAAKLVDLKELDAIVEQLDDKQADVLRLVENVKRRDLSVFEEAEHLKLLHEKHKVPADELAKQVGMSVRSIYEALKLATAEPAVRKAVLDGSLHVSQAKLIARLAKADQAACTKQSAATDHDAELTHEELERHIRETYMVDLRGAPFDVKAEGLPCVGKSCAACPKNARNAKDEYPELKGADICTSPVDYRKKVDEHLKALALVTGAKVLDEKRSEKVFDRWGGVSSESFVVASDAKRDDVKQRSYKQLLGKEELAKRTVLAKTPKGDVVELLDTTGLDAALKKEGKFEKQKNHYISTTSHREKPAAKEKRLAKEALEGRLTAALAAEIVAKVEAKGLTPDILKVLTVRAFLHASHEKGMTERRKLKVPPNGFGTVTAKQFDALFGKQKPGQLLGILVESILAWEIYGWKAQAKSIAEEMDIKISKVESTVKAELAAEAKAKAAEETPAPKAAVKKGGAR